MKKILIILLVPILCYGQDEINHSNEELSQIKDEIRQIQIDVGKNEIILEKIEKRNDDVVGVADTIISWSGRIFAIFAVLLSFAAVYSGYQMSQIRKIKNDLEELYIKSKEDIEGQKIALQALREDFKGDKDKSLKLLFPLVRGQWYFYQGDYERALTAFLEAQKIEPTHPDIIRNLYRILANTGKTEEAIQNLEKLYREFPDDKVIKYRLAQTYRRNGQLENAELIIKDAALVDKYPQALYEYGSILMNSGKYEEAEKLFIDANRQYIIEEGVTKYWVFVNLALTQLLNGKPKESLRNTEKAFEMVSSQLNLAPSNAQLYSNLGLTYSLKNQGLDIGKEKFIESIKHNLPVGIAKSMINKLKLINQVYSNKEDDEIIKILADYIKEEELKQPSKV